MRLLKKLRTRFLSWLLARAIVDGFKYLRDQKLGSKVNAAMDKRMGFRSESIQKEVAVWLRQVASELET